MTQVAATAPQSASAASRWRHFLAIDEREAIIAFAQTAYERGLIALLPGSRAAEVERLGYDGYIGCEYVPAAGTENGLAWLEHARRKLRTAG